MRPVKTRNKIDRGKIGWRFRGLGFDLRMLGTDVFDVFLHITEDDGSDVGLQFEHGDEKGTFEG